MANEPQVYSDSRLIISYTDTPEDFKEDQALYDIFDEVWETFMGHLADRLNARLPGKWIVTEGF